MLSERRRLLESGAACVVGSALYSPKSRRLSSSSVGQGRMESIDLK